MGWREFISRIVASTAWPFAVFAIVLLFRRELRGIIQSIEWLKGWGVEAKFKRKADELEAQAITLALPSLNLVQPAIKFEEDVLERLLQNSPRVAVIEAFQYVEKEVQEAAMRHGLKPDKPGIVRNAIPELERRNVIPEHFRFIYSNFQSVRNELVHMPKSEISEIIARKYIEIAKILTVFLSQL